MAVKKIDESYICKKCGKQVIVTKVGGGTLVCCGESMVKTDEHHQARVDPGNMPDSGA
jgi:desulfoferrodoxin-like iron-binding protein